MSVSCLILSYNVCLHAGSCLMDPHKERPSQQSNNNGKFLGLPKSARIHRTSSSSGNSTNIDSVSMEDNSSKESSFTELNQLNCGNKHQ